MERLRLGLALCGSYCTFDKILPVAKKLAEKYDVTAIMSDNAASTDTRFGCAENIKQQLMEITGREPICTIEQAEPIGPKKLFDVLAVAPCTGNTLAKLTAGIAELQDVIQSVARAATRRPVQSQVLNIIRQGIGKHRIDGVRSYDAPFHAEGQCFAADEGDARCRASGNDRRHAPLDPPQPERTERPRDGRESRRRLWRSRGGGRHHLNGSSRVAVGAGTAATTAPVSRMLSA